MELYIKPISWSILSQNSKNPYIYPSIEIFGYTKDGNSIYVRILKQTTLICKFNDFIDNETISDLNDILNPTYIKTSKHDPKILIVRTTENISNTEYISNIIDIKQDPYGELESFWESKEIGPYEWLKITKYAPLPGKYTNCEFNIRTEETNILPDENIHQELNINTFFWNIKYSTNVIQTLSITATNKFGSHSYLIDNDDTLNNTYFNIIKVKNEKELINKFFEIYNAYKSDYMIYYGFDMTYLLKRLGIHNILLNLSPKIVNYERNNTQIMRKTIQMPGTEIIDLSLFYKKFYSHIKDYNLKNIGKYFFKDTKEDNVLISNLWNTNKVMRKIHNVCNNLGISIDCLLRNSYEDIINRSIYNIDPGILKITYDEPTHLRSPEKGIYKNVYVYDYSELYRRLLMNSSNIIASTLGTRLEKAPSKLIVNSFYSSCTYNIINERRLKHKLDKFMLNKGVISIDSFIIKSMVPLKRNWIKYIENIDCYISVGKKSSISFIDDTINFCGLANICRPKFKLLQHIISLYVEAIADNKSKFIIPEIDNVPIDYFVMTDKINGNKVLLEQICESTSISSNVKYIMTVSGPVLLSRITKDTVVDKKYYMEEINKQICELNMLQSITI
jgi:hypothetical protein